MNVFTEFTDVSNVTYTTGLSKLHYTWYYCCITSVVLPSIAKSTDQQI